MKKHLSLLLAVLIILLASCLSGEPARSTPVVTEVQKLQLRTYLQAMEIAQLRAQAAQRDFDSAKTDLAALLQTLKVDGYELDLASFTYRPSKPEGKGK